MLGVDDGVAVDNSLLIVGGTVGHGCTPQVDVGHQGMDGVTGHVAPVAPVVATVGAGAHDVLTGVEQVVQTMLQHDIRRALGLRLGLTVFLVGVLRVGHIAERPHQVEVAERAQGQHLGTYHLVVTKRELRVFIHHRLSVVKHDVAVVDDLVESAPVVVPVGRQQVDSTDIVERVVIVVAQLVQLIRTVGTPHDGPLLNAVVNHALVASVHHLVHIGLGLPEVLAHNSVGGVDGQEVIAAGEGCGGTAAQQTLCNIFMYAFGNHNFQSSIINYQLRLESHLNVHRYRLASRCLRIVVGNAPCTG